MLTGIYDDGVLEQAELLPDVYGGVDFSLVPERLDRDAGVDDDRFRDMQRPVRRVFERPELLDRMRNATMTGDRFGDAYAALIPTYGLTELIRMLEVACAEGVDAVDDPPEQLRELIGAMEATPPWLDLDLVRRGAAAERVPMATATPFAIRGAFLATFLNKYAALPMTMTGALSDEAAAKRVFETASFFTATTMPGALERHGKGFEAAAKVRLMHSMVRFHLLGSDRWDVATYGIPIPQVDQMPAGLIGVFMLSVKVLRSGRTTFDEDERATVELSRYRCFLLGLPADLLGETPQEIVDLLIARHISLREGYDDEICGSLVRGTLAVDLFDTSTLAGKAHAWLEDGFSRFVLIRQFLRGDTDQAEAMGIDFGFDKKVAAGLAAVIVMSSIGAYRVGLRLPVVADRVDDHLNRRLASLLDSYGHPDFVTDADEWM